MTDADTDAVDVTEVEHVVGLPDGSAACGTCGVAVAMTKDTPTEKVTVFSNRLMMTAGAQAPAPAQRVLMFAVCDVCRVLAQRAARLIEEHPRVRARIGAATIAEHQVMCALAALYVAGQESRAGMLTATDEGLWSVVSRLSPIGGACRWAGRFSPFLQQGVSPSTCAAERFAHVTDSERAAARTAVAKLLRARVTEPHPKVVCPPSATGEPMGCLFCGVDRATAWTARLVRPDVIGGRTSPDKLSGHLCPVCQAAAERVGAVGQTAMQASLLLSLGLDERMLLLQSSDLVGVQAWAVLGIEPVSEPWSFVPNLAAFRDELLTGVGSGVSR